MGNTNMFYHPKYYKELRKLRNNLDQVISKQQATASSTRAPDPGLKPRVTPTGITMISCKDPKPQATSSIEPQASSSKRQAPSTLEQGSSRKHQAP